MLCNSYWDVLDMGYSCDESKAFEQLCLMPSISKALRKIRVQAVPPIPDYAKSGFLEEISYASFG